MGTLAHLVGILYRILCACAWNLRTLSEWPAKDNGVHLVILDARDLSWRTAQPDQQARL